MEQLICSVYAIFPSLAMRLWPSPRMREMTSRAHRGRVRFTPGSPNFVFKAINTSRPVALSISSCECGVTALAGIPRLVVPNTRSVSPSTTNRVTL